jgi:hypothetical protein
VTQEGYDIDPGNVRLFVREFGTGHIVADLASKAERDSPGLSQLETAAGFIYHFDKVLGYFQLSPPPCAEVPTAREADQVISIMEPVAKDRAAYLHLFANGESDGRSPYDSKRAQTIQRMARRFLGANGPSNEVPPEELLALFQTVDEAPVKAGDRKLFLVDAELKAEIGSVRLYRVLKVKDFFGCG